MDKQHMIILGLVSVALILSLVLVSMKKKENFDYGYPYTYPTGFYPPPNGIILSTMKDSEFKNVSSQAQCQDAAIKYCKASSEAGSQSYLANSAQLSQALLDVSTKCGPQFPVKEYCSQQNPNYEAVNVIRGGIQHKPVMN